MSIDKNRWKLTAYVLVAAMCLPSFAYSAPEARECNSDRLLVDLERIHADVSKAKLRAAQIQSIGLRYAENCGAEGDTLEEALAVSLRKRGYPQKSIDNLRLLVAGGKTIAADLNQSEEQKARSFRSLLVKYPIAKPTGEAFDSAEQAGLVAGFVAGIILVVWAAKSHKKAFLFVGIGVILVTAGRLGAIISGA